MLPDPAIQLEKELFHQVADGDELAFEQLFHLYLPRVHRLVFQVIHSEDAVKDIVQEVFLQLWLGRDKLPAVDNPTAWIFRIAYNLSFRYLKKQAAREKTSALAAGASNNAAFSNDTEEAVNLSEISRLIGMAVGALPPQSRRIFQMSRLEGMKPAEIAATLNISVQGVRNTLTRSGRFIRDYLVQQGIVIPLFLLFLQLP